MSDQDLINLLLGVLVPLAVAVIMQRQWPDWLRMAVSYLIVFFSTIGSAWFLQTLDLGDMTMRSVIRAFAFQAVTSHAAFKAIWQPIGITQAIERKTSPKSESSLSDPEPVDRPRSIVISTRDGAPYRVVVDGVEYPLKNDAPS